MSDIMHETFRTFVCFRLSFPDFVPENYPVSCQLLIFSVSAGRVPGQLSINVISASVRPEVELETSKLPPSITVLIGAEGKGKSHYRCFV